MSGERDEAEAAQVPAAELRRLRKIEAEFEAFIGSFPDLYFRVSPEGRIVEYRARREELYVAPERFLGRSMREVLPEDPGARVGDLIDEALRSGALVTAEYTLPIAGVPEHYEARCLRTPGGDAALFVRKISDSWRARQLREQSLSLLRATLEATADAILVVDRDGRMVDWNQRFVDLWRIPAEVLEARDDPRAVAYVLDQLEDPEAFLRRVQALYGAPEREAHDLLQLKDGRVFERDSRPQREGSAVVGRVWSFRDVTERLRTAAERDRLLAETQEAVRIRDEFLSIASHELRTPLTSMSLAVQVLQRHLAGGPDAQPPFVRTALETAVRQGRHLGRLVDDLLSVSRIRAGRLEMRPGPMDLAALVREAVLGATEAGAQAGCALSLVAPAALPGHGDRERLGQVVTNLLTNALRYGAGKPIAVLLSAEEGRARLRVSDQGLGVAEVDQRRIFERFERGAPASHYGGLGLGLYIARQIVEAHDGVITLESAPSRGPGAAFTVELPWGPG